MCARLSPAATRLPAHDRGARGSPAAQHADGHQQQRQRLRLATVEITAAQNGDDIHFAGKLANQTITLTSGELVINKSLDIEWQVRRPTDGQRPQHRPRLRHPGRATVTLAGLTIANGIVSDGLGGGIANESGATLYLNNDTVAYNTAYGIGGGLWNDGGATAYVSGSTFTGNKTFGSLTFSYPDEGYAAGTGGTEGGAIDNDGTADLSDSTFTGNQVQAITGSDGTGGNGKGGAIATDGPLTVGGGCRPATRPTLVRAAPAVLGHDGGSGGQGAGGAFNNDGAATVVNVSSCTFTSNQAQGGNGVRQQRPQWRHRRRRARCALSLADAQLTLSQSQFFSNQAAGGIGGAGGKNGDGGSGGIGRGGAFVHTVTFGTSTLLSNLDGVTMQDNHALGGVGGVGGRNGNGGTGGDGQGGAIRRGSVRSTSATATWTSTRRRAGKAARRCRRLPRRNRRQWSGRRHPRHLRRDGHPVGNRPAPEPGDGRDRRGRRERGQRPGRRHLR